MSRVIYGTRVALEVGILGTAIATRDRRRDRDGRGLLPWLGRHAAVALASTSCSRSRCCCSGSASAPPARCAGCLGGTIQPGLGVIIFLIALANWTYVARIVRGLVLSLREREFVDASRALGASNAAHHVPRDPAEPARADHRLRDALDPAEHPARGRASRSSASAIRPPTASWGQMIAAATPIFNTAWWYMTFPGVALLLTVLAFNLLGDGLQDALNPKAAR